MSKGSKGDEGVRPDGDGGITLGKAGKYTGLGALGIGGVLLTVYGVIMIVPKALGQALFPFLPEEMQGPAVSSCCCSCCCSIALLLVVMIASKST
jgi:hypothetical protein